MGGIIGFRTPQYRKKFGKYRNIAKKKKCQDTATLQYRVKNRCHAEPLLCLLRLEQITQKW